MTMAVQTNYFLRTKPNRTTRDTGEVKAHIAHRKQD